MKLFGPLQDKSKIVHYPGHYQTVIANGFPYRMWVRPYDAHPLTWRGKVLAITVATLAIIVTVGFLFWFIAIA